MVLTLYGSPYSPCTKRAAVVMKEKDIPFTFVTVDLAKREHKLPEYVKKQPFGMVPYIVSLCSRCLCQSELSSSCHYRCRMTTVFNCTKAVPSRVTS